MTTEKPTAEQVKATKEIAALLITKKPTPPQVKSAREATGFTQLEISQVFGLGLRSWQKKEETGASSRSFTIGEYNLLLLLAEKHPDLILIRKDAKKT